MDSPSRLDKEDEDYEPIAEDSDDDEYRPGKKRKPKKKKKPPLKYEAQNSSSKFQFVAEIPIEFDVEPLSNDEDSRTTTVEATTTSNEPAEKINDEKCEMSEAPARKKPRKMITPQRTRTDNSRKVTIIPVVSRNKNNGTREKDPLSLPDSADGIPRLMMSSAVNRFPCGYCDTVFTDISFLERHHKRCKAKRTAESLSLVQQGSVCEVKPTPIYTPSPSGRFMYSCDQCSFSTKNPEHLKYHRPIHNVEKIFACTKCKFSCRDVESLKTHKLNSGHTEHTVVQENNKTEDKEERKSKEGSKVEDEKQSPDSSTDKKEGNNVTYTCDQCSYTTAHENYLIMHKKIHVRDMPYQCTKCGYKCSRLAYFTKHRLTHGITNDIFLSCGVCSFTTSCQSLLDSHQQGHNA